MNYLRVDHVQFFDWWIQYMAVFEGSISPGEVSRKSVSITHGMERKTQVEILASLYAPNVCDALATYFCRKQDFVKSINKMIKTMKRESLQSIPLNAFHVSREAYEAAQREILSAVVAEARKL